MVWLILSFYLEEDEDKEKVLANVKKELEEMSCLCECRRLRD